MDFEKDMKKIKLEFEKIFKVTPADKFNRLKQRKWLDKQLVLRGIHPENRRKLWLIFDAMLDLHDYLVAGRHYRDQLTIFMHVLTWWETLVCWPSEDHR